MAGKEQKYTKEQQYILKAMAAYFVRYVLECIEKGGKMDALKVVKSIVSCYRICVKEGEAVNPYTCLEFLLNEEDKK